MKVNTNKIILGLFVIFGMMCFSLQIAYVQGTPQEIVVSNSSELVSAVNTTTSEITVNEVITSVWLRDHPSFFRSAE